MTSKEARELINLKDRNHTLKTQLDQFIQEKLSQKGKESSNEKEILELKELIKQYQFELSKERTPRSTLGQKMVLLDYFKVLDFMIAFKIDWGDLYKLLSYILDADEKSVSIAFNQRGPQLDSPLNNKSNNKFLVKVFHELKMKEAEIWAQNRLDEIQNPKK
jgi:hypothetical protein